MNISHSDLIAAGFKKGAGGQWYNPNESSDEHVHLIGKNSAPDYDPVKNPHAPEVLSVEKVEIKVSMSHRWWGEPQHNGTFHFDTAKIGDWGNDKQKAETLLNKVPAQLRA